MYEALYRKWRPLRFADVVGQGHVTETLRNEVVTGRISHAYLFTGTRGTGKTSCAKILARAVNCQSPRNGDPCNECPSCRGILDGSILDVIEIDAASYSGVDNIRALRDESVYAPTAVNQRVYIIDEVHMLSTGAFNALLTILEEPPLHLLFILATTETHKVLPTILSRCQRFNFRRITPDDMKRHITHVAAREGASLSDGAAGLLARLADGSLRDALSLLDQCMALGQTEITTASAQQVLGLAGDDSMYALAAEIAARDASAALARFSALYAAGRDPISLLDELTTLLRDVLLFHLLPENSDTLLREGIDRLAAGMSAERLTYAVALLQDTLTGLRSSGKRLDAEVTLLRLCDERLGYDMNALLARVTALEEMAAQGFAPRRNRPVKPSETRSAVRAVPEETEPSERVSGKKPLKAETKPEGTAAQSKTDGVLQSVPDMPDTSDTPDTPVLSDTPDALNSSDRPDSLSKREQEVLSSLPDGFAEKLCKACAPSLPPITAAILQKASMTLNGSHLELGLESYEAKSLKKPETLALIQKEASSLLGREAQILFAAPPAPALSDDPLEALIDMGGAHITVEG